jgi:hypothetical protein
MEAAKAQNWAVKSQERKKISYILSLGIKAVLDRRLFKMRLWNKGPTTENRKADSSLVCPENMSAIYRNEIPVAVAV